MNNQHLQQNQFDQDYYNILVLSIYFYLKHNNYNQTADQLFNESNLAEIFNFPNNSIDNDRTNEEEKLKKKLINSFYYNSYFKANGSFDLLSYFWADFWNIFASKIKGPRPLVSPIDKYLLQEQGKMKLTYNVDMYYQPNK